MKFYYIDKPLNISSFDVIRILRKKLNTSKMWHTWTLDPLATGGLLIAIWSYTKLIPYFEKDKKTYEFEVSLDWTTDSYDLGEPVKYLDEKLQKKYKKELTFEKIDKIIKEKFTWEITQIPPKYSALKINWKKAYELAREWKQVEIKPRTSNIFSIEILDFNYPKLSLRAEVSAWTYVRSIASDLWDILWTGWYVTKLRRTKVWNINISLAQNLENFNPDNFLEEKELFNPEDFVILPENIQKKVDNWLQAYWDFDYPVWKKLFVFDWNNITNVIEYNWEYIQAIRKI